MLKEYASKISSGSWPSSHSIPNIGIVDDDVYPTLGEAHEMYGRLQSMAEILFEEYTKAGLQLHLQLQDVHPRRGNFREDMHLQLKHLIWRMPLR